MRAVTPATMEVPASNLVKNASMGIVACIVWDLAGLITAVRLLYRVGATIGRFLYRVSIVTVRARARWVPGEQAYVPYCCR